MERNRLTRNEVRVLKFIEAYIDEHDFAPSQQEMAEHLGHRSRGNVNRVVHRLRELGFIDFTNQRARDIVVKDHGGTELRV